MTSLRRGTCPGIREPMQTGDGWLARWTPHRPIPLGMFVGLCDLSQRLGSGVLEVTQRGSIQIRGLRFGCDLTEEMRLLGAHVQEFPALISAPLTGLQGPESGLAARLCEQLAADLAAHPDPRPLDGKISITLDYPTSPNLQRVSADIRLFCAPERVHLALGGDAASAIPIGWMAPQGVGPALERLLALLAQGESGTRGRDLVPRHGLQALQATLGQWLMPGTAPASCGSSPPIDAHPLAANRLARTLGLAFGFSSAATLRAFALAAEKLGVAALRPAPDRTIAVLGIPREADAALLAAARDADLIASAADPRRYVIACAGAPICSSAHLRTRELAPRIAAAAQGLLTRASAIHLSGCPKGCAHSGAAALTYVGPDMLILDDTASAAPTRNLSTDALVNELQQLNDEYVTSGLPPAGNPYRALSDAAHLRHIPTG